MTSDDLLKLNFIFSLEKRRFPLLEKKYSEHERVRVSFNTLIVENIP